MDTVKVRCAVPCFLTDIKISEIQNIRLKCCTWDWSKAGLIKCGIRHLRHPAISENYYIKKN